MFCRQNLVPKVATAGAWVVFLGGESAPPVNRESGVMQENLFGNVHASSFPGRVLGPERVVEGGRGLFCHVDAEFLLWSV